MELIAVCWKLMRSVCDPSSAPSSSVACQPRFIHNADRTTIANSVVIVQIVLVDQLTNVTSKNHLARNSFCILSQKASSHRCWEQKVIEPRAPKIAFLRRNLSATTGRTISKSYAIALRRCGACCDITRALSWKGCQGYISSLYRFLALMC